MRILKRIIVVITLFLVCFSGSASPLSVKAKLDSVRLLMGRTMLLHLEVVETEGTKGYFPLLSASHSNNGYIGLNGDSVELRLPLHIDTVNLGSGRIQLNYSAVIQAFDSGEYQLPAFIYKTDTDSAVSNNVSFKVYPVPVNADADIDGFADVEDPDARWYDSLPDFIVDWWWIVILVIIVGLIGYWLYRRYRKDGAILGKKPAPNPYETAINALRKLKEEQLWEKGMEREYFTRLTEILRIYLEKRFCINAMEMTSKQIMMMLTDNAEIKDKRGYMRQILDVADFVKFARMRPLPADNIEAFDNAVKFVEETKPIPVEDIEKNTADDNRIVDPVNDKEKEVKK